MTLRPTPDRVREALFNILGERIASAAVLDLFAGSGAVGLEALSRGARLATFVEAYEPACRLIENGSSLKEVADVLRHRSLETPRIYAKLDTPQLAGVALPWPGSAR